MLRRPSTNSLDVSVTSRTDQSSSGDEAPRPVVAKKRRRRLRSSLPSKRSMLPRDGGLEINSSEQGSLTRSARVQASHGAGSDMPITAPDGCKTSGMERLTTRTPQARSRDTPSRPSAPQRAHSHGADGSAGPTNKHSAGRGARYKGCKARGRCANAAKNAGDACLGASCIFCLCCYAGYKIQYSKDRIWF